MNDVNQRVLMVNGKVVNSEWAVAKCAYHGVPDYMADGLHLYLIHRIPPGSFMMAVLSNDLMMAVAQADENNARCLKQWAQLLYCELPPLSFGSPERIKAWLQGKDDES